MVASYGSLSHLRRDVAARSRADWARPYALCKERRASISERCAELALAARDQYGEEGNPMTGTKSYLTIEELLDELLEGSRNAVSGLHADLVAHG